MQATARQFVSTDANKIQSLCKYDKGRLHKLFQR